MTRTPMFLRADVAAEPAVDGWYAWSHLLAPHTAALHLARSHLRILDSFVKSPAVHAAAVKSAAMRGGPFLDLAPARASGVAAFAAELRRARASKLALAAAIEELERTLASEGTGASLEALYARVPDALRGQVELVYDSQQRASLRFIERLLYRAHDARAGQALFLRRLEGDEREFVLSTPRNLRAGTLELRTAFDDPALDALFRARWEPADVAALTDALHIDAARAPELAAFFHEAAPPPAQPSSSALRVRYFGHACVLVECGGASVLVDPLIAYRSSADPPRFAFEDLPERIDLVLITHGHQDHLVLESLLPIRSRIGTVVVPRSGGGWLEDPSLKLALEAAGFARVLELDELESLAVPGGEILALPFLGEHGDLRIRAKCGWLVRLGGRALVFAADSNNLESRLYDFARDAAGSIDALFLGMECDGAPASWLYGALFSSPLARGMDQSRRLCGSNFERARELVERLAPARVFVYAMGQEPWCSFITSTRYTDASTPIVESNRLIEQRRARGQHCERLFGAREIELD